MKKNEIIAIIVVALVVSLVLLVRMNLDKKSVVSDPVTDLSKSSPEERVIKQDGKVSVSASYLKR